MDTEDTKKGQDRAFTLKDKKGTTSKIDLAEVLWKLQQIRREVEEKDKRTRPPSFFLIQLLLALAVLAFLPLLFVGPCGVILRQGQ